MSKYKLRPHQAEALKAVTKELEVADRCHMIMACGTGKTITALAIAESMKPKSVVIFAPSLALINQLMKEWVANTSWQDYETLAICSDDSVTKGVESESILLEEIDFPVANEHQIIKKLLNSRNKKLKILFCTYQSASLLQDLKIDLAIFDEAHKTAGYGKDLFSYSLHDENIKIKKRLFMTATPRHASISRKTKTGEGLPIYSMDDESLYGKRAYTLGFREAINLNLICDYKIIISVANANANANSCLASNVAALKKAILKSKATKIISYHKSINDAKEFSCANFLSGFKSLHISGQIGMQDRINIMQDFKTANKALICNARCLTEGIDIPAIDMVAFMNPKTSKIDIVQAIGRALRNAPNKKIGYVFLPIFLDDAILNQEEAISSSDFSHIWEVLNALSEQDSDLNDVIREIAKSGEESKADSYRAIEKFIDFNEVNNAKFINSIQARILNGLYDSWDIMYGQLCQYKKLNGNCLVSYDIKSPLKSLAHWVRGNRIGRKRGLLSQKRIQLLDDINFAWAPTDEAWHNMYTQLVFFYKKNKHSKIPHSKKLPPELMKLCKWVGSERRSFNLGAMPKNREDLLKKVKFDFSPLKEKVGWFENGYPILLEYVKKHGKKYTGLGGIDVTKNDYLRHFIQHARTKYKAGLIPSSQVKLLEEIDIVWDPAERCWNNTYEKYKELILNNKPIENLQSWVMIQRKNYKKNTLDKDKIEKLKELNFYFGEYEFDSRQVKSLERYKKYIESPESFTEAGLKSMKAWIQGTRSYYKTGGRILAPEFINELTKLGFEWVPKYETLRDKRSGRILTIKEKKQCKN
jgi:superfamily II DNA or RNA helicase